MYPQSPNPLSRGAHILIVGCGDVGLRLGRSLAARYRVSGTCRNEDRAAALRYAGITPVILDLDRETSLVQGLRAALVVHLMPPPSEGTIDWRSRRLMRVLGGIERMVYISTSGVYGDCGGAVVDESRPVNPQSPRALRRVDAERFLRARARSDRFSLSILRVPGIYAADRLPEERLKRGTPILSVADDVYTNHVHADDLVQIICACLYRGRPMRIYHASDDCPMLTSDYFELVANALGLKVPERMPKDLLLDALTPMQASFMRESRRLSNRRLHCELGVELRYPSAVDALAEIRSRRAISLQ